MIAAQSAVLVGVEGQVVRVEVEGHYRGSSFDLSGLPDVPVRETRMRVRSAIEQAHVPLPHDFGATARVVPPALRGGNHHLDLAVACALLGATGEIQRDALEGVCLIGELSLSGDLRSARGVLPMLLAAKAAGITRAIVPADNADEASLVEGIVVFPARTLLEVLSHLRGGELLRAAEHRPLSPRYTDCEDLADVRHRRALQVAAVGGYDLLLDGLPHLVAFRLGRALLGLLPRLTPVEAIEASSVHSAAGLLSQRGGAGRVEVRPFRAPHHTVSATGLLGGGDPVRPGEVTLAHHGVLFLDQFPEFSREVLEALREPLETGTVTVVRERGRTTFPARCQVVASMMACPCGTPAHRRESCRCSEEMIRRYRSRVGATLTRRPCLRVQAMAEVPGGLLAEPIAVTRARVVAARERGMARGETSSRSALERVARTIADLDGLQDVTEACIAEARGHLAEIELKGSAR